MKLNEFLLCMWLICIIQSMNRNKLSLTIFSNKSILSDHKYRL
uniref:Uncharacterized protein n=1 Tax=Anguilla anguilla TaxID=7936 RepID=A0A0E9UB42_ANGAN